MCIFRPNADRHGIDGNFEQNFFFFFTCVSKYRLDFIGVRATASLNILTASSKLLFMLVEVLLVRAALGLYRLVAATISI
jgi:hypothetical protein